MSCTASQARNEHRPRTADVSWNPRDAIVATASNRTETSAVCQLRYRVYVHEQGKRPEGIDWQRGELSDPLDDSSCLWYAREGDSVIGTITQTIVDDDFDLTRLPAALELETFPREAGPFGYSSRFAIAPDRRSLWVLPSLARHSYAHGRMLGGKFDFMAANPGRVGMFERIGYVRYTNAPVYSQGVGLLLPMILPATDHAFLRRIRSPCLAAAVLFHDEPQWREWLLARRPIIDLYYSPEYRRQVRETVLVQQATLPADVAEELDALSFVQHFGAGTVLQQIGDRVTCAFLAFEGKLVTERAAEESQVRYAPDGVLLADTVIRSETDAVVLCAPEFAISRLRRRHPGHSAKLDGLI
jgi:hypothetical protein